MRQFVYLSSGHSDAQHMEGVRIADLVRTSQPRTLNYRSENPSCVITKYVNVAHSINNISPTLARANGWICLDDNGAEIRHTGDPSVLTEFALDLHIGACRQAVAEYCKTQKDAGYDGIYGDYLGKPFGYNKYHYVGFVGFNHADGTPYTDEQMSQDMLDLIQLMRSLDCGVLVGNAIPKATGSYAYFAGNYKALSDPITAELDWIMIEGALGWDEPEALSRSVTDWNKCIQMWKELPANIIMYCKPIGNTPERANFALGSYMKSMRTDTLYHYSSVSSYQYSDYWQSLMGYDYGDYVEEGLDWVKYDYATFRIDRTLKTGTIEYHGGETDLSFEYKNETDADTTLYKRKVVITDTPVVILANSTRTITLEADEVLVEKD